MRIRLLIMPGIMKVFSLTITIILSFGRRRTIFKRLYGCRWFCMCWMGWHICLHRLSYGCWISCNVFSDWLKVRKNLIHNVYLHLVMPIYHSHYYRRKHHQSSHLTRILLVEAYLYRNDNLTIILSLIITLEFIESS